MGSSKEAQPIEKYFVAAKGVVENDGTILALLRGKTAPTHPLHWDLPGGILEYGESIEECFVREVREEAALEIDVPRVFHAVSRVNALGEFWTTVFYTAHARSSDITISWEHDEYKWVAPDEFVQLEVSQRNREAVERYIELHEAGKI